LTDNVDRSEAVASRLRDVHRKFWPCGFGAPQFIFAVAKKMDGYIACGPVIAAATADERQADERQEGARAYRDGNLTRR
jgi:hypothetical protein